MANPGGSSNRWKRASSVQPRYIEAIDPRGSRTTKTNWASGKTRSSIWIRKQLSGVFSTMRMGGDF